MTAAPNSPLVLPVARTLCGWRNGKRSAVLFDQLPEAEQAAYREQAQDALTACHAEEMLDLLLRLEDCNLGNRTFNEAAVYGVWRSTHAFLEKLDIVTMVDEIPTINLVKLGILNGVFGSLTAMADIRPDNWHYWAMAVPFALLTYWIVS